MKILYFIIATILSLDLYAYQRVEIEQYIENGIIKTRRKNSLSGIGPTFIEKVTVKEEIDSTTNLPKKTITVFVRNCKNIELKDSKAQELKNGDAIKFRLGSVDSCDIKSWEKYKF